MKAYVLNSIGQLDYIEVQEPRLKMGEVLVAVKTAGICGSDIPRIFETGAHVLPIIPGHEFAGVVDKVSKENQEWLIGKRVCVFPLIPCMKCNSCKQKQFEMCLNYDYLGSRRDGGFAEYVAVPERNLIVLPEDISFEAAAMIEPAAVGIHALRRINIDSIHSAAIWGTGTIGLLMAQWLRILGIDDIVLVGTRSAQKELATSLGFSRFVNCNECDPLSVIACDYPNGVDLAIECTGYDSTLENCIQVVSRAGNVLCIGNPHSDVHLKKEIYWQLLRKQLKLVGSWNSSFIPELNDDDWKMTIRMIREKKLNPEKQITHKFCFDKLMDGLVIMKDKSEFYNKIMIIRR